MVYSFTTQKIVLFGWLYNAELMKVPEAFYCPAETDPRSMLRTVENPWPPGSDPAKHTYSGYGCRPEIELPDDPIPQPPTPFPRLRRFRNKAIFADLTATPARLDTRHKTGINVLYGDGSAIWIDRQRFDTPLLACPALARTANPYQDQIWDELDRR
jgi:prepilin-type processing-associated H-X9-DG protein